jgi:hypothetical protein
LVHPSHHQVWQLFYRFAKFVLALLGALHGLNFAWLVLLFLPSWAVISKNFRAPSHQLIRMFTILTETVTYIISNRLGGDCVLLFE